MKSVHKAFASSEARKNLISVGSAANPATKYTKSDFLTPTKVGEKFSISTQDATKLMEKLYKRQATFILNGHKSPVVLKMGKSHTFLLHPMANIVFQQQLDNQKG